jgi:uncharacterized membrane protein
MFKDIRFIAAMRTLAVFASILVGAGVFQVLLIYGSYQIMMLVLVGFVLCLSISMIYSLMLDKVKQEQNSKKLSDRIADITK